MKKWYNEEYEFEIEVTGFLRGDHTEHYCRNGEEVGDQYTCTYGCPVNKDGQGICSKTMMMLYPLMEAVRSGGDLENLGGSSRYVNDEQHPEQGGKNSEGYSDLHFIENEIVPESGTGEDEYVPESGTGLYFIPELPTEDEQRIKVEKYGYLNPRKADYIPHDYIKQVILRGTGFEGGFDGVVQIFQNEMEAAKRTALIKKEYGIGGASWPVDGIGLHGYDTYGSQGIRFQWRDEQGEAEGTLSWSSVEQEIGTLILTGEYKSRDRQNNDIIPEAEESDNISQTTEMQEQSTDKHKSEAPEQLSFTDFINIEPDKTENDTQPEALDETEAEHPDNVEQQNNEDFTETSIPKGAIRRCEIQGRNDTGENWRTDTEMIPKHDNLIGR